MDWNRKEGTKEGILCNISFPPSSLLSKQLLLSLSSPPLSLSLSLSLPLPLQCSTSSIFFGTRSISFFLCVRLTDKVPPALILKKSLSLSLSPRPIYPWRRTHSCFAICGGCSLARSPTLLASLRRRSAFVVPLASLSLFPLAVPFLSPLM